MPEPVADVLCVGLLVADLFAPPMSRLPHAGELFPVDDFLLTVGGCAANTGVDLHTLGVSVAVCGKVGRDAAGDFIEETLRNQGVRAKLGRSDRFATSRTVILPVVGEDRRYIHAFGANADFSVADIDRDAVRRARVLYVGGYLLMPGLLADELAELLADARAHGVTTVLDVAGVQPGPGMTQLGGVLRHTDVFLPNTDEAFLLTGASDPCEQASILQQAGANTVGITLGGAGSVVCRGDERLRLGSYSVNVVDPSGGGDAFDAGFIVGLLDNWDLRRTAAFASAVGAAACTRLGCTAGILGRAETEEFVAAHTLRIEAWQSG